MKKVLLLPNVITALSLACGLFVIFKINMVEPGQASFSVLQGAAVLLILAAVADVLDGAVARLMHAESEVGLVFDSMADAVSFGVAPSVIILKSLSIPHESKYFFFITGAAMVYSFCGILRLVRFNVKNNPLKPKLEEGTAPKKKIFTGMPIPAAAAAAVSANLFFLSDDFRSLFSISEETRTIILMSVLVVLGYFMVSRWKFPGLKALHFRVRSFYLVFLTVVIAVLLFYGIFYHFATIFFGFSWCYLIVAMGLSIFRLIAGKRAKTLDDFEPASQDLDLEE